MATAIIEKRYVRAGETDESLEGVLDRILDSFIEDGIEADYLADLREQVVAWSFRSPGLSSTESLDRAGGFWCRSMRMLFRARLAGWPVIA